VDELITVEGQIGPATLSVEDRAALRSAVLALERPSLAARLSNLLGQPLDLLGRALPPLLSDAVTQAVEVALKGALRVALTTLSKTRPDTTGRIHKALAAISGAVGGACPPSAPVRRIWAFHERRISGSS